ncbi:MAG: hypothetical protein IKN87_04275 [Bacilli bacterium]|nr:hypothetical protein [Bacilli bacterium]
MHKNLKEINNRIDKYVNYFLRDNNYEAHIERLNHFKSFTKILIDNIPFVDDVSYKNRVSKEECINYAYEFLESISPKYGLYLFKKLDNNQIEFVTLNEAYHKNLPLCSYYENGFIYIVLTNDISDTYDIIHELMHDTNNIEDLDNPNFNPETRDYFTETISFLATTIAQDFFAKKYPNNKEFKYDINSDYYGLYKRVAGIDYVLQLIDAYLINNNINQNDIELIEKDKSPFYINSAEEYIDEALNYEAVYDEDSFDLLFNEGYLLAGLLTNYILNTYPEYEDRVKVLKDLNELIMVKDYKAIFNYLDLDVYELDDWFINLTDDSLAKLEKSFKEESKKI